MCPCWRACACRLNLRMRFGRYSTSLQSNIGAAGTIVASNLSYLDSSVVRAAGARALPSSFNAYVFLGARTHGLQNAAHLNLEVI